MAEDSICLICGREVTDDDRLMRYVEQMLGCIMRNARPMRNFTDAELEARIARRLGVIK